MIFLNKQTQNIICLIFILICNFISLYIINTTYQQVTVNTLLVVSIILILFLTFNFKKFIKQCSIFNFLSLKYFIVNQSLLNFLKQQNTKAIDTINSQKKYIKYNDHKNNNAEQIAIINNSVAKQLNDYIQNYQNVINSNHTFDSKTLSQQTTGLSKILSLNNNFIDLFTKHSLDNIETNVDFQKLLLENTKYFQNKKLNIKNISFNINTVPIKIDLNKKLINILLKNILDNAYKFSNKNTNITIKAYIENSNSTTNSSQSFLHCEIYNEGVYIDSKYHEKIFEPFYKQYNNSQFPGNGLGLTICKEIIELHNGNIWIGKNHTKSGTNIHFTIPLKQSDISDNLLAHRKKQLAKDSFNILVIDDEFSCYTSVELILKGSIFKTYHAINGNDGLELLNKNTSKFDIILLDLMMPGISGIDVLKSLKSNILSENIPVIIQSGTSDETLIQNAMKFKDVLFIRKPYSKNKLLFMLNSII